ncbi:transposase, IS5 family [Paracoccus halophilus]|uniref:Transposase, IS5 family n=1 Tax=Paracoccus halophilus TaxID=376733 RepID=A0A1I0UDD1_9RHOB|nr:transposase, IS5 family [Paracoccus halophilus]
MGEFLPLASGPAGDIAALGRGADVSAHAFRLSDEAVVARWVENPYYQHFTGETFFQHRPPIDPSSLSRWRKRIGEEGVEWLLTKTIEAGRTSGAVSDKCLKRVVVDTTVMEKNIAHPTDARLYERARALLVGLAQETGIELRQSYARLAPRLVAQVGRYAHARQFKRMRKALRQLKGYAGRVRRHLRRHLQDIPEGTLRDRVLEARSLVGRLLEQGPKSKHKIYSLHEPEVDCISRGKARVRYEFGTKVWYRGRILGVKVILSSPVVRSRTRGTLTGTEPIPVITSRSGRDHGAPSGMSHSPAFRQQTQPSTPRVPPGLPARSACARPRE